MQNIYKALSAAFAIHLGGLLVSLGTAWLVAANYEYASYAAKVRNDGTAYALDDVLKSLAEARAYLFAWLLWTFALGFVAVALFLVVATQSKPSHPDKRGALLPLWAILLLAEAVAAFFCWWFIVQSPGYVAYAIAGGPYTLMMTLSFTLLPLCYYFGTALLVKPLMVPSVPLAKLLRGA